MAGTPNGKQHLNVTTRPRAVTIHDVAREAGVAASTVSRTFTNPQVVNATTREHIQVIADRLGYRPNLAARAVKRGTTETLALLVPDTTNPHFSRLMRGAVRQASAAGFTLILSDTEESAQVEDRHIERLGRAVDGFILGASRLPDDRLRQLADRHRMMLVNRDVAGIPRVLADQADSITQIVDHLASLGHKSIAYLSGPRESWAAQRRWRSISEATASKGVTAMRLGPFPPYLTGGAPAADAAIGEGVTAVITHNGLMGIGVLRRMAERGINVPSDMSVVACDDVFSADYYSPALTARAAPMEDIGRTAVNVLLQFLSDGGAEWNRRKIVLPAELVIRGSTAQVPQPNKLQTRNERNAGSGTA